MDTGVDDVGYEFDPLSDEEAAAFQAAAADAVATAQESAAMSGADGPLYPSLDAWVNEFFCVVFARHEGKWHWCPWWYLHEEACIRLDYLWFAFEDRRRKPGLGLAEFLRHLDSQMSLLLGPEGPFAGCSEKRHSLPPVLRTETPPLDWWAMTAEQREEVRSQVAKEQAQARRSER